ncbi:MAG: caspase family protein [Cytophagales bacterium]|nr:caspase family protein [Bernardetiaceae bacterium]MDW8210428.1 caspase family protein [Cytophagales bacterium]
MTLTTMQMYRSGCKLWLLLCFCQIGARTYAQDSRIYAVVVGIADYLHNNPVSGLKDLNFCDDDARAMHQFLSRTNAHVVLLTDAQATKRNILQAMTRVFGMASEKDKLLFFFSGHGSPQGFIPHDFNSNNFLFHSEIKALFKQSKARLRVCIADACHAGSIKQRTTHSRAPGDNQKTLKSSPEVVVIMSSRSEEVSQEDPQLQRGVFTYFLLKALSGRADANNDRKISITELFNYLSNQVAIYTNQEQHPIIFGRFDKNMIIVNY